MQALVYEGPRSMHVREVERPPVGPGDVLIRVAFSGICGSELSGYLGHNSLRKPPQIFGHELSGTIAALGVGADDGGRLAVGQAVTANPLVTCGRCRACLAGRQQLCPSRRLLSASLPGSNATFVVAPARSVFRLPAGVSLEQGALTEPIACAVRVAEFAAPQPHETALVLGAGPIGLFAIQVLRLHGVGRILAVDTNRGRLDVARRFGAEPLSPEDGDVVEAVRSLTDGGADLAVEAVGYPATRQQCVQAVRPGGRVVFVGLHVDATELPINTLIRSEITCYGSFTYSAANFDTALGLIAAGRAGLAEGIVVAPLADGTAWYERLLAGEAQAVKVLLEPAETAG